jgi:hypothetical protein
MSAFYLNTTPLMENTKVFCQNMQEDQQKLLALMISQCHLQDLGKSLIDDPKALHDCLKRAASSREILLGCLKQLTESGANAYTHYVAYVQHFCTRLTQELVVLHQIDAQALLVRRYEKISNESLHQLESLGKWKADFLETLALSLQKELQQHLQATFQVNIRQYLDRFIKEQAHENARVTEDLVSRIQEKQHDQEIRHNEWLARQNQIAQDHLKQLERQQEKLQDHQAQMDKLSETVVAAVNNVLPLTRMPGFLAMIASSYMWMSLALQLAAGMTLIVFLTRPKRCRPIRHYLVAILVVEVVIEVLLYVAVQQTMISELARNGWARVAQKGTIMMECLVLTVGMLMSFCRPASKEEHQSLPFLTTMLELEHLRQRHEQALKKLEAIQGNCAGVPDAATVSSSPRRQVPVSLLLPPGPVFRGTSEGHPIWYQHHGASHSHLPTSHVNAPTITGAEMGSSFTSTYPPAQLRLPATYADTSHLRGPAAVYLSHPAPSRLPLNTPGIARGHGTDSPTAYSHPGYGNALTSQSFGHESSHGKLDAMELTVDMTNGRLESKKRPAESLEDADRERIKKQAFTDNAVS